MAAREPTAFARDIRETVVVNGRFAMRAERLRAAREGATGRQVISVEHVAERLAGGFLKMVGVRDLKVTIKEKVLPETNLGDLESIRELPGLISASASTLMKFWLSGVDPNDLPDDPRLDSIRAMEAAVVEALPPHLKRPQDLLHLACARAHHAQSIFGRIIFRGMTELHPVWRPLLTDISQFATIVWEAGPRPRHPSWIAAVAHVKQTPAATPVISAETSATPRHEAVEAMRWARRLIVEEGVSPKDIAIATVDTKTYDDHFVALKDESDIGLHIAHGVPATLTRHGQAAAALADLLLRPLSQKRMKRFIDLAGAEKMLEGLPEDWERFLKPEATLASVKRWEEALGRRPEASAVAEVLLPVIRMIANKETPAETLGRELLSDEAFKLWDAALVDGPAGALDMTIQSQRVPDGEDPHSSACYMSAEVLAATPRKYARLVGLSSRGWPRGLVEDALIPSRIIPSEELDPMPTAEADRRDFLTIACTTAERLTLSWPRRDAEGRSVSVSSLVDELERHLAAAGDPNGFDAKVLRLRKEATRLRRTALPEHAFSEADRLASRAEEFAMTPWGLSASACWKNWQSNEVTAHDGIIAAAHPRIEAVFGQHQSATSIRSLLRDPLGFVWKYALGFSVSEGEDDPLTLDPRKFGNIVHEVLRRAVKNMERHKGFSSMSELALREMIRSTTNDVCMTYELGNPVPPALVWERTNEMAANHAAEALIASIDPLPDQKSFVEAPFGGNFEWLPDDVPWDPHAEVRIPGTAIRLRGYMDRVDLSGDNSRARVIDYKSGKSPKKLDTMVIDGGKELQRCIYGFAIKSLLGNVSVEAGLVYPSAKAYAPLDDLEDVMALVAEFVEIAKSTVDRGIALPGIDAKDSYNDLRFALPANAAATYLARKNPEILVALGDAVNVWNHE